MASPGPVDSPTGRPCGLGEHAVDAPKAIVQAVYEHIKKTGD